MFGLTAVSGMALLCGPFRPDWMVLLWRLIESSSFAPDCSLTPKMVVWCKLAGQALDGLSSHPICPKLGCVMMMVPPRFSTSLYQVLATYDFHFLRCRNE
jgi:hypothetical protein